MKGLVDCSCPVAVADRPSLYCSDLHATKCWRVKRADDLDNAQCISYVKGKGGRKKYHELK